MTTFFRKNFSVGVLDVALKAAPDYVGDPGYDEVAVVENHTLPSSTEASLTDVFTLVIWSDTVNPGDDPNMEIVTATRTSHPRVYQIVERGAESTSIVVHPVGSYVGLHYTAGVSNADMEPILDILAAAKGSLIYAWQDLLGNKYIEILPPGDFGQVLVTSGSTDRPFWDWVWLTPGAAGGPIISRTLPIVCQVIGSAKLTITHISNILANSNTSTFDIGDGFGNGYNHPEWFITTDVVIVSSVIYELLFFSGTSSDEQIRNIGIVDKLDWSLQIKVGAGAFVDQPLV